jgi:PIN domain nuclease of toxin-antitoxin system
LILIDTHVWIWWVSNSQKLSPARRKILDADGEQFALSIISCWEVAKLVQYGRLELDRPVREWIDSALALPNLELLPLTPAIVVDSTQLPEPFHRDPADQIIVATARVHGVPLLTEDSSILEYHHVQLA